MKVTARIEISARELEIARLIDAHLTFDEIADKLGISPRTVKAYSDRLRLKLGVKRSRQIPQGMKDCGISLLKPTKGKE